jgi:hypothetical protein
MNADCSDLDTTQKSRTHEFKILNTTNIICEKKLCICMGSNKFMNQEMKM